MEIIRSLLICVPNINVNIYILIYNKKLYNHNMWSMVIDRIKDYTRLSNLLYFSILRKFNTSWNKIIFVFFYLFLLWILWDNKCVISSRILLIGLLLYKAEENWMGFFFCCRKAKEELKKNSEITKANQINLWTGNFRIIHIKS